MTISPMDPNRDAAVRAGLECGQTESIPDLKGKRFGLLMNEASISRAGRYSCDVLSDRFPGQLVALFSPQHGLWGEQQANMRETGNSRYPPLDVPVFSLYGETRAPAPSMLRDLDVLVVDLQDVGVRVYTYAWTVLNCLEMAAQMGIPVVILDRPNPIGGQTIEGRRLDPDYRSFVGQASIPMRHGLTLAELASFLNDQMEPRAELHTVPMRGWQRSMYFDESGLPWIPPSPNLPQWTSTLLYPGMVLLEGTNLSEGRGTTRPFEVLGAPYVDPWILRDALKEVDLPGLAIRPIRFQPTFDVWQHQSCGGIALHVHSPRDVRSFSSVATIISMIRHLWPGDFQWLPPPYEYEMKRMPIDIISGNQTLRTLIDDNGPFDAREVELSDGDVQDWWTTVQPFLIYP